MNCSNGAEIRLIKEQADNSICHVVLSHVLREIWQSPWREKKIVITVILMQKEARDQAVWLEVRILQTLEKYLYKIASNKTVLLIQTKRLLKLILSSFRFRHWKTFNFV